MKKRFSLLCTSLCLFILRIQATDVDVYPTGSIQAAIDSASAGDRILLHAGTYSQSVSIENKSGLTLTSAGDGTVIIQGNGTADHTLYILNPTNITVSNLTIRNTRKQKWVKGIYVDGYGSGVQILNNFFTDISYRSGTWNASDNPGSDYELNANPLVIVGSSTSAALSDIEVSGNEVSYCMTGWSESVTIKGNVDGFTVEDNTVHHVTNIAIDAYGLGDWPNAAQARNGLIKGNVVYNAICTYTDNGGIYVDGGRDIVIANNKVYNSVYGITIGCENQGQVTNGSTSGIQIVNNLVYNNAKAAIMIGTAADDDGLQGDVVNTLVTGNTFLKNSTSDQWGGEIVLQNCSGITFYNNIVYGSYQQMVGEGEGKGSCTFGYNIFYNPVGSPLIGQADNNWNTISFATWKGQNNDNSSLYTDPLLTSTSATAPDVHLQATSPAIDAGKPNFTPLSGEVDIDGQARIQNSTVDIGVDESGSGSSTGSITIDGSLSDWSGIATIATATGQSALSLKVYDDGTYLYFGISGSGFGPNYQILINSDNNASTGYDHYLFSSSGADHLIENGTLSTYNGDGSSWNWGFITSAEASAGSSAIEARIAKADLSSLNGTITVAFADINSSWSVVSTLGFSAFTTSGARVSAGSPTMHETEDRKIAVYPNPVSDYLNIDLGNSGQPALITIHDTQGRLLLSRVSQAPSEIIRRSEIPAQGVLILRITSENVRKEFKISIRK